jgi:tetratricopeptide (TPR) repeat protein
MKSGPKHPSVIFCGAGISFDIPSGLPRAEELGLALVRLLLDSSDSVFDNEVTDQVEAATREVRLEVLLELLARQIAASTLVRIFECLCSAIPNRNHFAIAAADFPVVLTTNQDILLESAAARLARAKKVIHLHGRCDQPQTIVALISQYVKGLPAPTAELLKHHLECQFVVVVGYSGRDRDVIPVLAESKPDKMLWLQHPGSRRSLELAQLATRLGERLEIRTQASGSYLWRLLGRLDREAVTLALGTDKGSPWEIPLSVQEEFGRIDGTSRNLALAELLRHTARYGFAERIYQRLGGLSPGSPSRVHLAIAAMRKHAGSYASAISIFESFLQGKKGTPAEHCQALLGLVETLRAESRGSEAARRLAEIAGMLTQLPPSRERARIACRAASLEAGLMRVSGELDHALDAYLAAIRLARESQDLDDELENRCWYADIWRMKGDYKKAHAEIASVLDEALLYVRHSTRAWFLFVGADIDCARGTMSRCFEKLRRSAGYFRQGGNRQGIVWTELLRSAQFRIWGDLNRAATALDNARRQMTGARSRLDFAKVRLYLESAELARASGAVDRMKAELAKARRLLSTSQHFGRHADYLRLHASLVAAEYGREAGHRDAERTLEKIAAAYRGMGMDGCGARAQIGAWLCKPSQTLQTHLLDQCILYGRRREVLWLRGRATGRYPIYFA